MKEAEHHLAAVWFADIGRFSRLAFDDESASVRLAGQFQHMARLEIGRHGGRPVKFLGDGVLAEFPSALGALHAALSLRDVYDRRVEEPIRRLHPLRFGVHLGEVYRLPDGDLYGHGINMAARIMAQAEPGEILTSDDVRRPVARNREFAFRARGLTELAGVGAMELHSLEPGSEWSRRDETAALPRRAIRRRGIAWVAGSVLLLAAIGVLNRFVDLEEQARWVGFHSPTTATARPAVASLAVLPFRDMTWNDAGEYLGAAVAEGVFEQLSVVPGLDVIDTRSTAGFRDVHGLIGDVAQELGVELVLEGSVRQTGSSLRVTARLVEALSDQALWARIYERDAGELAEVQRDIAAGVVEALRLEAPSHGSDPASPTPAAYALYLQARYQWNRRDAEGVRSAIELYRRALAADPGYARAYAGLAKAYVVAPAYAGFTRAEAQAWARAAAETALALDPGLGEAHTVLGQIAVQGWDWAGAEREFTRALDLAPGDATAHHWYAVYLASRGQSEEALSHFDRAEALDPLSLVIVVARGVVYVNAAQWDRAIAQYRKALDMDPSFAPAHGNLVEAYELAGRYTEAIETLRRSGIPLQPSADELKAALTAGGPRGYLEARARALEAADGSAFVIAGLHAAMADRQGALRWLEESYRRREPDLIDLAVHPWFREIRAEPRFKALLRDVGLARYRG